ncbi:MAG: hypothetical protein MI754_18230 [Chromatiales bacterium]|nr:hypothetical protein [Chromatiales bacterium]
MSIVEWIVVFSLNSLFWKWIVSWGGAQWVEGWKAFFVIDWFAAAWTAEQIRLYGVIIWFCTATWFVLGVFIPGLRGASLLM